jgi:outer membrane protein OmpA-like peptidoglycan-associated protein
LGYPINTKDSEGTICVSLDGKTAYYGRGLPTAATRLYDIYNFEMPVAVRPQPVNYLKALVYDKETEKRLVAKLEFVDLASQKIFLTTQTDENGDFLVCLPYGKNYALNVSCKGYSFASENFNLTDTNTLQAPFLLAIGLVAIKTPTETQPVKPTQTPTKPEESKAIVLKNVFFETNQAILLPASVSELTRLKLLLEENPAMNIEIRGHTDNVGNDADNQSLSERRAQAVVRFLIENGIASNRLTSKGFGETQPIATNDTPEGRAQNRRTEFVILSK